jgi:hypothetical protein
MIRSTTKQPMTFPTPDANGTISWSEAIQFVWDADQDLNFLPQFAQDYSHLCGERIDLGELEVWRSDLIGQMIADLVFG